MTDKAFLNGSPVGVCLGSMSFYPLYAGPALRFQRYGPGLQQRGARLRVFTQAVTPALIARDGSIAQASGEMKETRAGVVSLPPEQEIVDGMLVQRVELPDGWLREPAYFRRLAAYCRKYRGEIDVVQLLNADFLAAPWLIQLRRLGLKLVFTHTLLSELSPNRWKQSLQRFHRRVPLNMVDAVVVSSQEMQRKIQDLNPRTPVQVIPNGVDLKRFHPVDGEYQRACIRQELGLNPDWDIILAIGPIIPRKGTDVLVEAFVSLYRDYTQARLVLVGPRHDLAREDLQGFHQHLQRLITESGAGDRVIFTGPVSNVHTYLQAADFLVFPSRREGMPNVVPEAMATALPVVMTPFTGLPVEFGKPGEQYLLSSWEPSELAQQIRRFLDDPTLKLKMGRAARDWVANQLDLEKSLDAYMELYRSPVRGKK